jgi:predicted nucleic acid-binding protein
MKAFRERLVVDCSVVMRWQLTAEPFAAEAKELMLDGETSAIEVCAPDQLRAEVMNAMLRAYRRNRLQLDEARVGLRQLLSFPFTLFKTTPRLVSRAFEIAAPSKQHAYDCIYVALAEGKKVEFWTGDERLYNALHSAFPLIRRIADYQRKRP